MKLKKIISSNKIYLLLYLLFLIVGSSLFIALGKRDSFIFLNSFHTELLNQFFIYYTNVGDGLFSVFIGIVAIIFFRNKPYGLSILFSYAFSGISAQLIKRLVDSPRPKLYFANGGYDHFIEGVKLYSQNSFPSGHTATAFAMFTVIALFVSNKNYQWPLLIFAIGVGYSRVYLGQHFLLDVLAGSFIGVLCGILAYYTSVYNIYIRKKIPKIYSNFNINS
jgi:membrane-associated phospholipid phosphatase